LAASFILVYTREVGISYEFAKVDTHVTKLIKEEQKGRIILREETQNEARRQYSSRRRIQFL